MSNSEDLQKRKFEFLWKTPEFTILNPAKLKKIKSS